MPIDFVEYFVFHRVSKIHAFVMFAKGKYVFLHYCQKTIDYV